MVIAKEGGLVRLVIRDGKATTSHTLQLLSLISLFSVKE